MSMIGRVVHAIDIGRFWTYPPLNKSRNGYCEGFQYFRIREGMAASNMDILQEGFTLPKDVDSGFWVSRYYEHYLIIVGLSCIDVSHLGDLAWIFADGWVRLTASSEHRRSPYRITGVLEQRDKR